MERALDAVVKLLNYDYMDEFYWTELARHHVQALMRAMQSQHKSPATRALYLSAIKGVMKEAWLAEIILVDQYQRINEIKRPRGARKSAGKALDLDDVSKAITACDDNSKAGTRDKLALLLGVGLRRFECAHLQLNDVYFQHDKITVIAKGDKEITKPVDDAVMSSILDWLFIRGEWKSPLFCGIRKGKLSDSSIYLVCRKRGIEVDVDDLKPHNLRRTYVTELFKAGVELETICDMLGLASMDTTRTYTYDDKKSKKKRDT